MVDEYLKFDIEKVIKPFLILAQVKHYITAGFAGPIISFTGIFIAVLINRDWWTLTDNAISDLGKLGLQYNYVLNLSLIVGGAVTFYSTWFMKDRMQSAISKIGFYFFMITIFSLSLIGIFPEGTAPHGTVSKIFFYGGTLALLIVAVGIFYEGEKKIGLIMTGMLLTEIYLGEFSLLLFKGIAISELIAAIGIVSSYYLLLYIRGIK